MKKRVLFPIGMLLFLFVTLCYNRESVIASGDCKINLGEKISVISNSGSQYVDIEGLTSKKIKVRVEITNVCTYDIEGNRIDDDIQVDYGLEEKERHVKSGEVLTFTDYFDNYDDNLLFETRNAYGFSLDLKITKICDAELKISCRKSITMKDTGLKTVYLTVYYGDEDVTEFANYKVKASKKNLVDADTMDTCEDGYFFLSGSGKAGKCKVTVTVKYKGQSSSTSFVLKLKSTLKKNLYVLGDLYSYNTRSNTFKMDLTNRSKKPIKIYSKGAVALDDDYYSFDRNVKLTKNKKIITIKSGKCKTISWKVIGRNTWYDVEDFEIHFKCKYKGKVSWLSVQGETVYIWKKKKWRKLS